MSNNIIAWKKIPKVLLSNITFPPIVELEISKTKVSDAINDIEILLVKIFNIVNSDIDKNIKKHV